MKFLKYCKGCKQLKGLTHHHNWNNKKFGKHKNITLYQYYSIHRWIKYHYGKADRCAISKSHLAINFNWANISGNYIKNINDWIKLCPQDHAFMDKLGYSIEMLQKREQNRQALLLTL